MIKTIAGRYWTRGSTKGQIAGRYWLPLEEDMSKTKLTQALGPLDRVCHSRLVNGISFGHWVALRLDSPGGKEGKAPGLRDSQGPACSWKVCRRGGSYQTDIGQPKSFASKVASIITRLKPTPQELAEVRKIARKVTRRATSNRKGRRP